MFIYVTVALFYSVLAIDNLLLTVSSIDVICSAPVSREATGLPIDLYCAENPVGFLCESG